MSDFPVRLRISFPVVRGYAYERTEIALAFRERGMVDQLMAAVAARTEQAFYEAPKKPTKTMTIERKRNGETEAQHVGRNRQETLEILEGLRIAERDFEFGNLLDMYVPGFLYLMQRDYYTEDVCDELGMQPARHFPDMPRKKGQCERSFELRHLFDVIVSRLPFREAMEFPDYDPGMKPMLLSLGRADETGARRITHKYPMEMRTVVEVQAMFMDWSVRDEERTLLWIGYDGDGSLPRSLRLGSALEVEWGSDMF
ncbi:uncharacterized protein F5Z01DRAFT_671120 [Emericellopsis atlantica]|uniref:Uncharacterized protein n=1 Tax=Emericellopsis atlantica TaxID=2614577 RepID=A0A9P7ZSI3_9HYPO|nr:uncharacterized protein F5Z01DRAFT_671120 [Emericellopsis atlantica]KAG9257524.1 hypothetical protein F5Z01DRAFT_671120 [Emericellopsis atlantica]